MESKIIIIDTLSVKEMTELAFQTWNPVLEKALTDYYKLTESSKKFLCRFCHEYSLNESSEFNSDTGTMSILNPSGRPTEIKSMLPYLIKILGKAVVEFDGLVNFHISSMPAFTYIKKSDGLQYKMQIDSLHVNQQYPITNEYNGTNLYEVHENLFIERSIEALRNLFKTSDDVIIYPVWHLHQITTGLSEPEPSSVMRLLGRISIIESELPKSEEIKETPERVGKWIIGGSDGIEIHLTKRPKSFHIFMNKLLLGIEWIDNKETTGPFNG